MLQLCWNTTNQSAYPPLLSQALARGYLRHRQGLERHLPSLCRGSLPSFTDSALVAPISPTLNLASKCTFGDEQGDLFDIGLLWSLCHCVSQNLKMGSGIAVSYR